MSRTISPRDGSWFRFRSRCRRMPDSIWFRRRRARIRQNFTHSGNGWRPRPRANPESSAFLATEPEICGWSRCAGMAHCLATLEPAGENGFSQRLHRKRGTRSCRSQVVIVTLTIMAFGTVVITFCPTYATIGIAAPVIVLIGRLLQGFSAGVELGGVSVYLAEISTPGNRGFYTSFQSASQQVAIF